MKLDEILNSQKASAPVASTPMPVTKKTGTLRLSDILSQEPSESIPVQEVAPVVPKVRTVTNDDNTIKEGINIAPTFTKTQKAKMGANLAYNAFTEGMWGLPEAMVRSVPSLAEGLTRLSKYTDPNYYLGKVTGSKVAEETNRKNLEQAQKFTKLVKENTGFLDEWKQLGEEYRKAEDAGVPEEFRNSLTGKVSSGVGSSASFLTTLLATRGLGMGAQYAGAGTKIGETLAILANTSQKLGIPLNTLAESQQIKEQTKQELLDMGKNEKEAERLATNVFGVSVVATPALDAIGLFNPAIKKTLVKKLAQFGLDIGSEISQELTQTGAQNVATDKEFFANAKETTTVAGITSAIFSLLTKGHLSLKGEQAQPTATEPTVQADGTVTPPPEGTATPTVGDIIANGQENYTQEEKVTAINNADFENNLVDPTNEVEAGTQEYEDLKSDIKSAVDEGANIGEIILKLREAYTVSQEYAENIVAEVIATPEATAVVEEVVKPKTTPKKVVTTTDLKAGTEFENVGTLQSITQPKSKGKKKGSVKYYFKHADGVQKYYTEKQALELVRKGYKPAKPRVERAVPQVVDKAKQYGFDNVQYYFDNTDAPETVSYYDNNEKDYVGYRTSTVMADFPEHLRDRKLLNEVEEYWYKQTRPEDTGTQASKNRQELYDYLAKQVDNFAKDYNKKLDEQMSQKANGDNIEFKTKQSTASREMAVLDDFKKRYKVQFPTLIVDKIIQGKKTKLHPKGDGTAEGATDGNTIAIAFDAVANTGKHEIVHLTLNNLDQIPELARFSREDILKAQAKKMGVVYDAKKEEKDSLIEEQLALDIELYENKQYKPNDTILAKFFASISKMLKDFRSLIVKTDGDVIKQYYDAVLYGKTERKQEVAITTESNVARYLIDNVLDYRPMYQTRRVLSLSNGIKSIDFKVEEEQDLIVHHNLTEKKLLHTDKLGGLPVPSIAISNKDNVTSGFGDIILVGNKDLIDPKIKTNKAFNADSYSARYPKINYYVEDKTALDEDFKKVKEYFTDPEILRSHESGFYTLSDGVGDYGIEGLYRSRGVKAMFAIEKGASKDSTRNDIDDIASNNRDEFEKFADKIADKLDIQSSIYNGYTASGNRRSGLPHTLENVVKKMKGSGRTDENFNYGVGSLRSAVAKKFKNIKEIQADRKKLISEEEMAKLKDETSKQFSDLMDKHNVKSYFDFADNIVDYELGKISASQLKQYTGINDKAIKEFEDFGKYLAGLPSEYFEVKMQRAVKLNEFKLAIVPEEISKEAEDILTKNGLIVKKYNKENRQEVIASNNEVFFKERQPEFKEALTKSTELYKESGDLTTKILKDLEGKTTVSKQYILDATNRGDIKQVEKDLIRSIVSTEGDKVNVKDFAEKVKLELLPLSTQQIINSKYEFVNLPDNVRGDVKDYKEKVYESPVQTSAGSIHFPKYAETSRRAGTDSTDKYFGHTRIEDMADKKLRRVIEVQSDLYQKGRIEQEGAQAREIKANPTYAIENRKNFTNPQAFDMINSEADKRLRDVAKLEQYNDPTAHFRMIREEIRSATLDGKDVLQFPTGETAMKIEGLGSVNQWGDVELSSKLVDENPSIGISRLQREARLTPENLKIGKEVNDGTGIWIITDVLGDGKFKAVPKTAYDRRLEQVKNGSLNIKENEIGKLLSAEGRAEQFDISGKVDTNNPIYKFYEKEVGRYLKNNYKAETVTDDKGVTWYEVKLKDEYKGAVVAFKERVTPEENREEARKMFPRFAKAMEEKRKAQLIVPKKAELGIRSVAKRVEERAKTLGVTVDESYEIKRFVTEVATSEVILENNKEKIEDILNGSFPYPTEVSKTAFLHTVIEDAKARNDTKTLTKAYNRLAEEATTAGQDIAFINSVYKMYDETSPETYLNKIKAERETMDTKKTWSIKNPFAGKEVREKIIRKKTERQKAIRLGVKERTTIKIQELESILDSFVC